MAVRKHEKGAIFKENQRISNAFRIAGVRSTEQSVPYTSTRVISTRIIDMRKKGRRQQGQILTERIGIRTAKVLKI